MANYVQNTRKYEKWFKEGRGQGQKETYKALVYPAVTQQSNRREETS